MKIPGNLEWVAAGWLYGWARRAAGQGSPEERVKLVCRVNGETLPDLITANRPRVLLARGVTEEDGFLFQLPASAFCGRDELRIELSCAHTGQVLAGSPWCVPVQGCAGQVGGVRQLHLTGWAVHHAPSCADPLLLEWLVDGQPVGQVQPGLQRPDLPAQAVTALPVGIRALLPAAAMDGQPHELALRRVGQLQLLKGCPLRYQASEAELAEWHWRTELPRIEKLADQGWEVEAYAALEALAQRYPHVSQVRFRAGEAARLLGLAEAALGHLGAVHKGVERSYAFGVRVPLLHLLGRVEEAGQVCGEALADAGVDRALARWAQVLHLAATDRSAAIAALHEAVHDEPRPDWQAKLLRWSRGLNLALPALPPVAAAATSADALDVRLGYASGLMRLGRRREAARTVSRATPEGCGAELLLRMAEFWLDASRPQLAKDWLTQALAAMQSPSVQGAPGVLDAKLFRKGIGICHELGWITERDQLTAYYLNHAGTVDVSLVLDHLTMLSRDGQTPPVQPALPPAWQARWLNEEHQHEAALALMAPRMAQPVVSQEDVRTWLHSLIELERMGEAQRWLERLAPRYPTREGVVLRSQLLRRDMAFEDAVEVLERVRRANGQDRTLWLPLAEAQLVAGDAQASGGLIEAGLAESPGDWRWGLLQLRWLQDFGHDWADWFAAAHRLAPRLGFRARLHLMQMRIHRLSLLGQFERASHLLTRYVQGVRGRWPMSHGERATQLLGSASLWLGFNKLDECQALLDEVAAGPLGPEQQQLQVRVASALESHVGRRAPQVAGWLARLPLARHHMQLLPALPTGVVAQAGAQRVAVLFHLYYPEMWAEFLPALQSLRGTAFRLHVSTGRQHPVSAEVLASIRSLDAQAVVREVENWGFDVGGHWQALDHIDLGAFDLVLLLQSKKSRHVRVGPSWRANLRQALIGTPEVWQQNLAAFAADPALGMIGSALHRGSQDIWQYPAMREVLRALGMPLEFDAIKNCYEYVGGTMLLMRAPILAEMHRLTRRRLRFKHYDELSIGHRLDHSLGHAMERAFGVYTRWRGYRIGWRADSVS